jgi:uncharacterized protein YifN (PemK superfamily)
MALKYAPPPGTILLCDFTGSVLPEMNKKRPVVLLSSVSSQLCIIVPLSTTRPSHREKWHYLLHTPDPLPPPYNAKAHWVKCDMISTVSFARLSLPSLGKNADGKRSYVIKNISDADMQQISACICAAVFPHIDIMGQGAHI